MLVYVCNRGTVSPPFALFRRDKGKAFQSLLSLPLQRYGIKVEKQTISTRLCAKVLFSSPKSALFLQNEPLPCGDFCRGAFLDLEEAIGDLLRGDDLVEVLAVCIGDKDLPEGVRSDELDDALYTITV